MSSTAPVLRRLAARWPTALGLVLAAGCLLIIVMLDVDVELATGVATMAGLYLVAYAVGRPASVWIAYPALVAVVVALDLVGLHPAVGMTVLLVVLWIWAVLRGRAHDGRLFAIETAGMVGFGAITLLAIAVDPVLGGVLAGVGWFAHGVWDTFHFAANKVVNRPWSEMCAVVDIPVGIALVVAALT